MESSQHSKNKVSEFNYTDLEDFSLLKRLKIFYQVKKYGIPRDLPRQIWIEITNKCNLSCKMCPLSRGLQREKKTMDMQSFKRIIDRVCITKPRIVLHVAGEPLLNNKLIGMISYAAQNGCRVGIHTNALLLDRSISSQLLDSPLEFITFSVDGFRSETYENIRRGSNLRKVVLQIEDFLEMRSKKGSKKPRAMIEIIKMKETEGEIRDFCDYWRATPIDKINIKMLGDWHGLIDLDKPKKPKYNFGHRPCRDILSKFAILVDGTVVPCCTDIRGSLPLGNILKSSFKDIWTSEPYRKLRRQHLKGKIPKNIICYRCRFRKSWSRKEQFVQWIIKQVFWRGADI